MKIALFVLGIALGLIGSFIASKFTKQIIFGDLVVDRSEPSEPPMLFLELKGVSADDISKEKVVKFKVINKNYLPQ